jgi:hypothetical protein
MNHEKIFTRSDGSKVKIVVSLYMGGLFKDPIKWDYFVMVCQPRKRTWRAFADTDSYEYRALSMADRRKRNELEYLKIVTKEEILAAKTELWELLKPV